MYDIHHREMSLVREDQPPPVIRVKESVSVLWKLDLKGKKKKSSGHAQMRDKDMRVGKMQEDMLSSATHAFYLCSTDET